MMPTLNPLFITSDGKSSIRWDLVDTTRFSPDARSENMSLHPVEPFFRAGILELRFQDALDAFASFKKYHNIP